MFVKDEAEQLIIRNNYQPRMAGETTGTGLKNLGLRYSSYLGKDIRYGLEGTWFVTEVPLITS
jgi:hypothetical protein